MVALAGVYGDLLEETERQWLAAKKEDPALDAFPEAARESLRRVLYGPGAPAAVGLDESEDLYLLDESVAARKHFADVERVYLKSKGAAARAMSLVDLEEPVEPRVLVRGDATRPGGQVPRQFPRFLSAVSDGPFRDGSGRLDLARAIVDPKNPLTARVIVNRVWNWHFGSPLVPTLSDFGTRTAPPTHPELLDYLATWFREQGWSIKALHRLIMTSNAYQQQSRERAECSVVDPENRLFWRMNGRRLEFEAMRDSMLRVSGELVEGGGGRPVEKAYDEAKYGWYSSRPYLDCAIQSTIDPDMAPPGKHVWSSFVQYTPYKLRESDWDTERQNLGDTVQRTIESFFPGFSDLVLHREVVTPLDIERTVGLSEGNIFAGEFLAPQMYFFRPAPGWSQYRTPIDGYYQCGSGTHPGGCVMGAPGKLAAARILKDLRRD